LRLQDAPVERRSGDSGFKDNGRSSGAELVNVDSSIVQLDQRAGRAIFSAVVPETEKLRGDLQEQDGGDDGEGKQHVTLLF
jgi:hypothetical protein